MLHTQKSVDGTTCAWIDWWSAGLQGEWRGLYPLCGSIGERLEDDGAAIVGIRKVVCSAGRYSDLSSDSNGYRRHAEAFNNL